MSNTLSNVVVQASVGATLTDSVTSPYSRSATINHLVRDPVDTGSTADKVDLSYSATITIADNVTPTTLDVTALTDPLGGSVNMAHVTTVQVEAVSATTAEIVTVGGGSNPLIASEQWTVQPNGGVHQMHNPNPGIATSGSAKNLRFSTASGTNVQVRVTILGRSA